MHKCIYKQAKYHPDLESPEEEAELKARFAKTDEMIQKHNSDPNVKHHIGHNHFSTMVRRFLRVEYSARKRSGMTKFMQITTWIE